jgi:fucose permease
VTSARQDAAATTTARNAVAFVFALNGFCFATFASRVPDLRASLDLSNGALGVLLLTIAAGAMVGMPAAGPVTERYGAATVVRLGALADLAGLVVTGAFATAGLPYGAAIGLFCYGLGAGSWDVAMNVEGAEVERMAGRSIMPRFHAGWSLGTFSGAGVGALAAGLDVPLAVHYSVVPAIAVGATFAFSRGLPSGAEPERDVSSPAGRSAWLEPRTLAIGFMVLAFTLAEGAANDWLALSMVDGYDARHWVGVLGFALFVASMTFGRLAGPVALDRFGRAPTLWASAAAAFVGVVVVVEAGVPALAVAGIVLWGLGAALGFPVGMSAAGDDPARAARRVSVVSTIGYGAFLGGPPLLGFVGDRVGTLDSLLVVAAAMVPASVLVLAVRPRARRGSSA